MEVVLDLRGQVTAVVDLHKSFGLAASAATKDSRVIVLSLGQTQVGVIVDGVSGTLAIPAGAVDAIRDIALTVSADYITGVARLEDKLVILLDFEKLLSSAERDELTALVEAPIPA